MYLCYIDESGVPEIPGNTSHFVLVGLTIEAPDWKVQDQAVEAVKARFGLVGAEIHTAWITSRIVEQERIPNFAKLPWDERRKQVQAARDAYLIKLTALKGSKEAGVRRRNLRKSQPFIHLTAVERTAFLAELADLIGSWNNVVLFGDAIDKTSFTKPPLRPPREEAFMQIISRFQFFLNTRGPRIVGLLVHDYEEESATRLTHLMREFHEQGTVWTGISNIIETPFFVDSELNRGVQLADLCSYATRRFFENNETNLFDRIYPRFRRVESGLLVGLRHYVGRAPCPCKVCLDHHRAPVHKSHPPAYQFG